MSHRRDKTATVLEAALPRGLRTPASLGKGRPLVGDLIDPPKPAEWRLPPPNWPPKPPKKGETRTIGL